ncbi:all trans-polyprenyl-diphosphate synthase PDSS1 [Hetaerina americana]|uniref:all trans-polyprenyl-diphosphate synthase PDSS1 n=1 Tax=Hetaerina americana TaxID=62018 RepID=UPI003A7F40DF
MAVSMLWLGDSGCSSVLNMACISTGRLCARVERFCQFSHSIQVRKKTTIGSTKLIQFGFQPSSRSLTQGCQRLPTRTSVEATCGASTVWGGGGGGGFWRPLSVASAGPPPAVSNHAVNSHEADPDADPQTGKAVDPYRLLAEEMSTLFHDIRQELRKNTSKPELERISCYYFDGEGKALRPMVALLMARAINEHVHRHRPTVDRGLLPAQRQVAMIAEMIHTASLIHDDVIDQSDFRRGKPSVNALWEQKKVAMAGDFILAVASMMIARLRNNDVTIVLSQVVTDLVQGEFMQLGSKETENERFAHYLTKTYRKTASLIANSVKAVAMLSGADESMTELAFQYGRNLGLAFQLVDDLLDFVSSAAELGKPACADLQLGLATAPVLFACEKFPELNPMIMRRFSEPGDVEKAFDYVHRSHGLDQTRFLAKQHCAEAARLARSLSTSPYRSGLLTVCGLVLNRTK